MTNSQGKLPSVTTAIPGPKSREIFEQEQTYVAPGRQRVSLLAGIAIDHGEGATLTDADGNVYVDFFAGIAVASLGHGHPGLAQAICETSLATDGGYARQRGARRGVQAAE